MENRESVNQSFELPSSLDVKRILDENRQPTGEDWKNIQGGEPQIKWVNKDLCYVIHNYENKKDPSGTRKIVTTPIPTVKDWGTIDILMGNKLVTFPKALLWRYHGKPCESRSNTEYDRVEEPAIWEKK